MGRKRRRTRSVPSPTLPEEPDNEWQILQQMGLPTRFGGNSHNRYGEPEGLLSVAEAEAGVDAEARVEAEAETFFDFESVNTFQGADRGHRTKGGKRKRVHLSEHTVSAKTCTVLELREYYASDDVAVTGNAVVGDEPLHTLFDEEGNPLVVRGGPQSTTALAASLSHSSESPSPSPSPPPSPSLPSPPLPFPPASPLPASDRWFKKYYRQRYDLFHRFDDGIEIDEEGWFSVTPELVAAHTATSLQERQGLGLVWDAFGGVGGNAIQFALGGMHVVASDTAGDRLRMAQHNAAVYGVDGYIDFIQMDALEMGRIWRGAETTIATTGGSPFASVFLSPPWGGPDYTRLASFDPLTMLPIDMRGLSRLAHGMAVDVIYYLPRSTDLGRLSTILPAGASVTIEEHYLDDRLKVLIIHSLDQSNRSNL